MKKLILVLSLLLLSGCKTQQNIKLDTIVDIPLNPVILETVPVTEPETEAATQPTEAPTEKKQTEPTQKPNSSNKDSGSGKKPAATQPPTEPPTQAPTQPPTEPPAPFVPEQYVSDGLDREVAALVNEQRMLAGLKPLDFAEELSVLAAVRALEVTQKWSHTRPDGSDGLTVLETYGIPYETAAETFYYGTDRAEHIVEKWLMSNSSQESIFLETVSSIGIAHVTTPDGLTYVAAIVVG